MADVIYRPETLITPVAEWARALFPETVPVGKENRPLTIWTEDVPPTVDPPLIYLATVSRPAPEATGMGWDDLAQLVFVGRFEGVNVSQTLAMAGQFREKWAGRARRGGFATELVLSGITVPHRASDEDGALETTGGRPQWTETFRAFYTRA